MMDRSLRVRLCKLIHHDYVLLHRTYVLALAFDDRVFGPINSRHVCASAAYSVRQETSSDLSAQAINAVSESICGMYRPSRSRVL